MVGETSKRIQDHVATLEEREARLTTEVAEMLKQNEKLLEIKRENKVEMDALRKELGQV